MDYMECAACGANYILDFGGDDDGICHDCAHRIATIAREYAAAVRANWSHARTRRADLDGGAR